MSLPYSDATGNKALAMAQIEKVLTKFGCTRLGVMDDYEKGEITLRFEYRGMTISIKASARGYANAWLKENPYSYRTRCTKVEHERKALEKGQRAVYSIVRDWIKGQITAVESGILSFENAFLGQIMLPGGGTVFDMAKQEILPQLENAQNQVALPAH